MKLPLTGSQTVGPFFSIGLNHLNVEALASHGLGEPSADAEGLAVVGLLTTEGLLAIEGRVLDSDGVPVPDVFLEVWHAAPDGSYPSQETSEAMRSHCSGFARVAASSDGTFRFTTKKPGVVPYDAERSQAPHLLVLLFMRGLLRNLVTRIYLPDEPANESDPVLQLVPAERRGTLIAQSRAPGLLQWDIVLRAAPDSAAETVFFAW